MKRRFANATVITLLALALFSAHGQQGSGEYEQAVNQFKSGNYNSAAELFARVDALKPGGTDALLYEGKCLIHLQNFAGAEKALRDYASTHSDSADALYLLGFVLNRENRPSESLAIYTKAAAIVRPGSDDLKIVGLDYVLLNDYADAIHWLERSVQFDASNKDAWYYLGRAYYTHGRLGEAKKAFQTVLGLDLHDARAESNLGLLLESEGQPAAALDAYHTAIQWQAQDAHPSEQPYLNLGNLLMQQGQTEEAGQALTKAVELAPNKAFCRMMLGVYYLKAGELRNAQRELEAATELDPRSAIAHYQLGRLYKETHELDRAKAEFQKSSDLQSGASQPDLPNRP